MRRMIWLLLALGCKPDESSQQTPLAEGFQMGAERCCDDPTTGTARLTERGMERGACGIAARACEGYLGLYDLRGRL